MLLKALVLVSCMALFAHERTPSLAIRPCNKNFLVETTPQILPDIERILIQEKGHSLYLLTDNKSGQKLAAIRLPFKCTDEDFFSYFVMQGKNYYLVLNHLKIQNAYLVDLTI